MARAFARLEFLCIFFTYDVYYNINYINRKCENSLRRFWASYLISRKNIIILMAYTYYLSPCTQIYFIQYLYPRKFSLLCRIYFTKVFLHKFILPSRLVVSNYLWCRKPNIMVLHFLIQFFNYSGSSGWLAYTCFQIKLSIFYIWPLYITIASNVITVRLGRAINSLKCVSRLSFCKSSCCCSFAATFRSSKAILSSAVTHWIFYRSHCRFAGTLRIQDPWDNF
jgi:hypothetical protein